MYVQLLTKKHSEMYVKLLTKKHSEKRECKELILKLHIYNLYFTTFLSQ